MNDKRLFLLDTDIGPDCDDAAALALSAIYSAKVKGQLLGVMHCTSSPWGVGTIRAILSWYTNDAAPVGTLKDEGFLCAPEMERYNKALALSMPDELRQAEDCTALYRKILARQEDDSVELISIGPLRNLGNLLASAADEYSELSGRELIARKVKCLTLMAGNFEPGCDKAEWNVEMDIASARQVAQNWPGKMVYCGFEVGYPVVALKEPLDMAQQNPVRTAYKLYSGGVGRNSWDLCTVQWAMLPELPYYTLSAPGRIDIDERGVTHFSPEENGKHFYLSLAVAPQTVADSFDKELALFDAGRMG